MHLRPHRRISTVSAPSVDSSVSRSDVQILDLLRYALFTLAISSVIFSITTTLEPYAVVTRLDEQNSQRIVETFTITGKCVQPANDSSSSSRTCYSLSEFQIFPAVNQPCTGFDLAASLMGTSICACVMSGLCAIVTIVLVQSMYLSNKKITSSSLCAPCSHCCDDPEKRPSRFLCCEGSAEGTVFGFAVFNVVSGCLNLISSALSFSIVTLGLCSPVSMLDRFGSDNVKIGGCGYIAMAGFVTSITSAVIWCCSLKSLRILANVDERDKDVDDHRAGADEERSDRRSTVATMMMEPHKHHRTVPQQQQQQNYSSSMMTLGDAGARQISSFDNNQEVVVPGQIPFGQLSIPDFQE